MVAVGKSPQFKVFPENSTNYFQIRFGKVYEAKPSGQRVEGHAISSLAGETQAFSFGECMLPRASPSHQYARTAVLRTLPGFIWHTVVVIE